MVVYKYLKDRGWVFMVRDDTSEVYRSVETVRFVVASLCAGVAAVIRIMLPVPGDFMIPRLVSFCSAKIVSRNVCSESPVRVVMPTAAGMLLLWRAVSDNAASLVSSDITNQMTDAVESRASIINDYVTSAEEYMTAFALTPAPT